MVSPNYKNRKTPGVYVTELSAFPNAIVGVETALPVFIGYTEKALVSGNPVPFTPILIDSLAGYQAYFGAGFEPKYLIVAATTAEPEYDVTGMVWDKNAKAYVPTNYLLTMQAPSVDDDAGLPLASFNLYNSVRLFYDNGGGRCYIVSVGNYADVVDTTTGKATIKVADLKKGLDAAGEQVGPTITVIPDAVLLPANTEGNASTTSIPTSADFQSLTRDMLAQSGQLQDRVALLDVYGVNSIDTADKVQLDTDLNDCIEQFQAAVGESNLNYGMAYFPYLITTVVPITEIDYTNFFTGTTEAKTLLTGVLTDQASYLYPDPDPTNKDKAPGANKGATYLKVKAFIDDAMAMLNPVTDADWVTVVKLNQNIVNSVPLLQQMENIVAAKMNLLPASGAMTGIFSLNDATRGVWNAPANMVVNQVIKPSVPINAQQQGPINVPVNGKAVNAIRDFVGRGPVVWGARTLDGNSADYRYIQVRRTLIYCESSIKTALNQFVFAPNNGQTWVAVTAMVSGFLQNLWSSGGLMGDKASDAFTVQCGLGSTMTGTDILNGYMIVQVTLQMIRPAEFIELTFKQKMEGVS